MPEPSLRQLQAQAQAAARAARAARVRRLPPRAVPAAADLSPPWAELHCLTHFSFQRGASSPEELVRRAWALGYTALAITDECSVAGVVRAWQALGALHGPRADPDDPELAALHAARAALGMAEPMRLIYGSEFRFQAAGERGTLVALAHDLAGWGALCSFITACRGAAPKGDYRLPPLAQALAALPGCERLWAPCRSTLADMSARLDTMNSIAAGACQESAGGCFDSMSALLIELHGDADDALWRQALRRLSAATGLPLVAAGDVQMHVRARKRLHDLLCAIRLRQPVQQCGFALQPNAERHLRPRARLAEVYGPDPLAATLAVAARCRFRLEEVRYNYPRESVLPGLTPTQTLARLTREGAAWRFADGVPAPIQRYIDQELALIAECRYEMFFLTVHDIVRWARGQGILCQGRGSAANSVVCYCLGITEADPRDSHPLLARFISLERKNEPPDIDVDFEHERREEVIQYIYRKYGRHRAALAATVITWRTRSALRDAGAALGVDARLVDAFAKDHHWFEPEPSPGRPKAASAPSGDSATGAAVERGGQGHPPPGRPKAGGAPAGGSATGAAVERGGHDLADERLAELAQSVGAPAPPALMRLWLEMTLQLKNLPRHLSQHVGGFVLTETPLHRLVPVEPAAMTSDKDWEVASDAVPDAPAPPQPAAATHTPSPLAAWLPPLPALRQVIQWDKDDLEALGMLKVDVLALGMLTAIRRCLDLIGQRRGRPFTRADIPRGDPDTYRMIRRADTVGTFQIESRAQMSMLPRLKPTVFYDLVVQVAIVRPGPITGGMVHPYLKARERQRRGLPIEYELSSQERLSRATGERADQGHPPPDRYRAGEAPSGGSATGEGVERGGQGHPPPGRPKAGGAPSGGSATGAAVERGGHHDPPRLAKALARTLGVPIFQEQVMELSMIAAGFSAGQADALRRAMAAWKRKGGLGPFEDKLTQGMLANGYSAEFAARIFKQIQGFGEYGFPESHAYSFALIAYESSWLKCHEPEAFLAAMLNSQPMGFYGPSQLIQDAQRHGVQVLPPDVSASDWDCTLDLAASTLRDFHESNRPPAHDQSAPGAIKSEAYEALRPAVRLGLRLVKGLGEAAATRIVQARAQAPLADVADLARRAGLDARALGQLASADALASLAGHRRQQVWSAVSPHARAPREVRRPPQEHPPPAGDRAAAGRGVQTRSLLRDAPIDEAPLAFAPAPEGEEIVHDYAALGLTLRRHPLALLRERLARRGVRSSAELAALPHGHQAIACGLVTGRQQPGTAKGTIFVTLEDETGPVNVIVWKSVRIDEAQRNALLRSQLLAVQGEWQRAEDGGGHVRHLIAHRLHDLTPLLGRLAGRISSRDFH